MDSMAELNQLYFRVNILTLYYKMLKYIEQLKYVKMFIKHSEWFKLLGFFGVFFFFLFFLQFA